MTEVSALPTAFSSSSSPTPEAPSATSTGGKSKKEKKSTPNKGPKKMRALPEAQHAGCVKQLIADAEDGRFPEGKISMAAYAKKFNVTTRLLKEIYLDALAEGMPYHPLLKDVVITVPDGTCYIDERWMCMIAKRFFIEFNEKLPDDKKFQPGQKFQVSKDDRKIILTPVD